MLFFCNLSYANSQTIIGRSEQEVVESMGQPLGRAVSGDRVILQYPSAVIKLQNNKVIEFSGKKAKETSMPAGPASVKSISKRSVAAKLSASKSNKYKKIKVVSNNGKRINPNALQVPNRITIVYFYADWCGLCSTISPKLEKLVSKYKDVCLRRVNIVHEDTPIAREFKVSSVPNVRVYDAKGEIAGAPTASYDNVKLYLEKLMKQ